MIEVIIKCDICKKATEDIKRDVLLPVKFLTNQTDGKWCEPYISMQEIDICKSCLLKSTNIEATGAMGCNTYMLKDNKE